LGNSQAPPEPNTTFSTISKSMKGTFAYIDVRKTQQNTIKRNAISASLVSVGLSPRCTIIFIDSKRLIDEVVPVREEIQIRTFLA
jgi:hypothetical protein